MPPLSGHLMRQTSGDYEAIQSYIQDVDGRGKTTNSEQDEEKTEEQTMLRLYRHAKPLPKHQENWPSGRKPASCPRAAYAS